MFLPSNITLQFGDSGDFVAELQRRLARVRCFDEAMVNGFYDGATVTGVSTFQSQSGLHVDGVAGPETLRRLNGVISGDTSSTSDDKKEEEEAKARDHSRAQQIQAEFLAQQSNFSPAPTTESLYGKSAEATTAAPAPSEFAREPIAIAPLTERAAPPLNDPQQALREQNLREPPPPAVHSPSSANDILVQMLLQSAPPSPQPSPLQAATGAAFTRPSLEPVAAPLPSTPEPPTPPTALPPAPPLSSEAPPPVMNAAPTTPAAVPPAAPMAEPKGIVGRAMQVVNSYIEKLGAYFEAKLPPSVMNEVKAIGEVMARSGMKETAIPGGPELPTRAQELPGRTTDQTPQRN